MKNSSFKMLVVFSPIFVTGTKITFGYNFVAPFKKVLKQRSKKAPPTWLNNVESKITALRKKNGQLTTFINCKNTGNFLNHQKEIKQKFYNKYDNTRMQTLQFKLTLLKKDVRTTSIKLKWLKKNHARQISNSYFISNTKSVFHDFKGSSITVNETPTKDEVEEFWKSIWEKETNINKNVKWLKELKKHIEKT